MSKQFYKTINEFMKKGKGGRFFIVINNGNEDKKLIGQKLFIQGDTYIYQDNKYKSFWENEIKNIDLKITDPQTIINKNGVKIFTEKLHTKPTLVLCGGGHVSLFVYQVALMVGFDVVVIDDREEFASKERFPEAKEVICKPFEEVMPKLDYGNDCYYVIVTRGHSHDGICVESILRKKYAYVGMIGSKRKVSITQQSLRDKGFTEEQINDVYTPIGLKIGAETPEEIAISIIGEIISVKRNNSNSSYIDDDAINIIASTDEPVCLAMILEKHGSIPRGAGSKMAITKSGNMAGTIGGGSIEYEAKLYCMERNPDDEPISINYTMNNDDANKAGMVCGGSALVYIESVK